MNSYLDNSTKMQLPASQPNSHPPSSKSLPLRTRPEKRLPPRIFLQPTEKFTLEITKHILGIFKKQGSIRKTSTHHELLHKLVILETQVSTHERQTVAQLISKNKRITRAALEKNYDESGEEVFGDEFPDFHCNVCLEILPAGMFRKGAKGMGANELTEKCWNYGHHRVCTKCVKMHMKAQCESVNWDNITCPTCPAKVDMKTVVTFLSGELRFKFKEYMSTYALRNQPGFCWCLSPSCRSGQIHTPGDESPKMICQKCGFATCYSHQLPWHEGKTCEEAGGLKSKEIRESEAWIKSQTKSCPKCGVATMKTGGCDGIFCRCGKYWDWESTNIIG